MKYNSLYNKIEHARSADEIRKEIVATAHDTSVKYVYWMTGFAVTTPVAMFFYAGQADITGVDQAVGFVILLLILFWYVFQVVFQETFAKKSARSIESNLTELYCGARKSAMAMTAEQDASRRAQILADIDDYADAIYEADMILQSSMTAVCKQYLKLPVSTYAT